LYVLIFFSVTSKYAEDEPIIYKLSELKKTQVMKNQHVLLKIKETKYCSVHCHALEPSNVMTILNSKAQGDPILDEHIATM
jgi:biopolymer transport protein ExbD